MPPVACFTFAPRRSFRRASRRSSGFVMSPLRIAHARGERAEDHAAISILSTSREFRRGAADEALEHLRVRRSSTPALRRCRRRDRRRSRRNARAGIPVQLRLQRRRAPQGACLRSPNSRRSPCRLRRQRAWAHGEARQRRSVARGRCVSSFIRITSLDWLKSPPAPHATQIPTGKLSVEFLARVTEDAIPHCRRGCAGPELRWAVIRGRRSGLWSCRGDDARTIPLDALHGAWKGVAQARDELEKRQIHIS